MALSSLSCISEKITELESALEVPFAGTADYWRISGTPRNIEFSLGAMPAKLRLVWDSETGWYSEGGDGVKHHDCESVLGFMRAAAEATLDWLEDQGLLTDLAISMLTEMSP